MKKRSFVLLEILIAFTLVSLCTLPFIRFPFQHMQKEMDTLFDMELERIAQNELAKLLELLYKQDVPEKILFDKESKESLKFQDDHTVYLPGGLSRTFPKYASISRVKRKETNQAIVSLINLHVEFVNPRNRKKKSLKADIQVIAQKKI